MERGLSCPVPVGRERVSSWGSGVQGRACALGPPPPAVGARTDAGRGHGPLRRLDSRLSKWPRPAPSPGWLEGAA